MPKKDLRQMKKAKKGGKGSLSKDDILKAAERANVKADASNIDNSDIENMEDTISQYENKSEGELMGDLEQMIANGRKDGSFTDEMLDSFIKNVAPMMDSEQRKKLDSIAKMIKLKKL